jgi:hypothetical protein
VSWSDNPESVRAHKLGCQFAAARRKRPEQKLQIQVADFLRVALRPPTIWTAFPAGGGGRVRGALLKAMGLQAGWPDILILHPEDNYTFVLGIELKAAKGTLSPSQKEIRTAFKSAGAVCVMCRDLDMLQTHLRAHGIPLHARAAV